MLIDSMKSEELSSLGNILSSLATGTYLDKLSATNFSKLFCCLRTAVWSSCWWQNSSFLVYFLGVYVPFFLPGKKNAVSRKRPSYGQIMALYNPYSDLDKNMLRGYAIWQMLSFPLLKKPHKCIMKLKLAIGLKYSLLILLELFFGLRQKTLLRRCWASQKW